MLGLVSRIGATIVVLALLSTAVLAVRGAMQDRRARAEQAWHDARQCARAYAENPNASGTNDLRVCIGAARDAAELSLEMPEHGGPQLELQAALDELVRAIDSRDVRRLTSAIDRSSRAGSALGWGAVHPRLP